MCGHTFLCPVLPRRPRVGRCHSAQLRTATSMARGSHFKFSALGCDFLKSFQPEQLLILAASEVVLIQQFRG